MSLSWTLDVQLCADSDNCDIRSAIDTGRDAFRRELDSRSGTRNCHRLSLSCSSDILQHTASNPLRYIAMHRCGLLWPMFCGQCVTSMRPTKAAKQIERLLGIWTRVRQQLLLHPLNSFFSRTTWISRYQKGKTSPDLNDARDDGVLGWQWHQLDNMQTICT